MIRNRCFTFTSFAVLTLAAGCGKQPALDVQQQASSAPASAAAAPAAPETAADPGAPGVLAAHETSAPAALPEGHPPTGGLPADHPPLGAASQGALQLAPVAAESGQGNASLAWKAPASWVSEPPANSMRRAQYRVPGPGGEGECVVFYFGPGQGGDPQANAERWASQFAGADGQPVRATTSTRTIDGIEVLLVEAAGTYQSGSMMGMGQGVAKPDWALLGAVAEGPDANWFFKFTAPRATIEANRAGFEALVGSLRRGG